VEADTRRSLEKVAWYALVASAFACAFSLPAGRVFLVQALLFALPSVGVRRWRCAFTPAFGLMLAWILLALAATAFGENPAKGLARWPKLLWFLAVPVVAVLVDSPRRLRQLVAALALGGAVLGLIVLVRNPVLAQHAVASGRAADFGEGLILSGSMTNGQRFSVLLPAAVLALADAAGRLRWAWVGVLVSQVGGLVMNLKRGAWVAVLAVLAVPAAARVRLRVVAALVLVVAGALCVPTVRARIGALREECNVDGGGRLTMWVRIAPVLVREHPVFGRGYRSLTNERMREIAPCVEPRRDHLHSNPVQMLVDTGWVGLALYLAWMAVALRDGWRMAGGGAGIRAWSHPVRLLPFLGLLGLVLNGLVEYNIGDSEIVLLYVFLMGMAASRPAPAASAPGASLIP
jgi:O-antigen ligase